MDTLALAQPEGASVIRPDSGVGYSKHDTAMHAQQCALHLGTLGGRGAARQWCVGKGFGVQHTNTVMRLAAQLLVSENRETVEQTRARLLVMLEAELEDASKGIAYTAKGEQYVSKDRSAIAQFTKLIVTLTGLDVSTVRHVAGKDRPFREMSTQDLLAEEERLAQALADRAVPAEGVVLTTDADPIPSDEKTLSDVKPSWLGQARDSGLALRARAQQYGSA